MVLMSVVPNEPLPPIRYYTFLRTCRPLQMHECLDLSGIYAGHLEVLPPIKRVALVLAQP